MQSQSKRERLNGDLKHDMCVHAWTETKCNVTCSEDPSNCGWVAVLEELEPAHNCRNNGFSDRKYHSRYFMFIPRPLYRDKESAIHSQVRESMLYRYIGATQEMNKYDW